MTRRLRAWAVAAAALTGLVAGMTPVAAQTVNLDAKPMLRANLQALGKITARVTRLEAPVGETIAFGSLRITTRVCYRTPPEEPPESAAFLEIAEVEPGQPTVRRFTGWMFASSPAVSAMDHAIYDVRVLDCAGELSGDFESEIEPGAGEGEVPLPVKRPDGIGNLD